MALPSAYQEVEYIKSTGTQYIVTTLNLKELTIDGKWSWDTTGYYHFFSYWNGSNANSIYVASDPSGSTWSPSVGSVGIGSKYTYTAGVPNVYHIEYKSGNNKWSVDGVSKGTSTTPSPSSSRPFYIFASNDSADGAYKKALVSLYYLQIKNTSGTLLANFVPCYRKSDLVAGLYDTVGNKFYTNAGTGTFTIGNAIYTGGGGNAGKTLIGATAYAMKGGKPLVNNTAYKILRGKNNVNGTNYTISFARLPAELQEVEYLQSSGSQYINIGLPAKAGYIFKSKLRFNSWISGDSTQVSGRYLSNVRCMFVTVNPTQKIGFSYRDSFYASSLTVALNTDYEIESKLYAGEQYINVNGTEVLRRTDVNSLSISGDIYLFGNHDTNVLGGALRGRIYYAQYYDNGTLVRDLVPCYRKADNVAGMYDLVSHVFYTNNGSGSFTVGPNV